jgi:putative DNA primase/helicase
MNKDINDILREGGEAAVRERWDAAKPIALNEHAEPAIRTKPVTAMNIDEFLGTTFPPRENMLAPWLGVSSLALMYAWRGTGKTLVAHGVAWAVACGGGFLNWTAPRPRRVLLIDGEMRAADIQERFSSIKAVSTLRPEPDYLKIVAADTFRDGLPNLGDPGAQQLYADVIGDADLVVADNLSTLCPGLKENDADSWTPVQEWELARRRDNKSVLLIHHSGKAGAQRGTSRKEDVQDTVIALRRPPDYSPADGARFEVHFEKSRGFYGPDAAPFEAHLIGQHWKVDSIKSGDDVETLKALHGQGLSVRDIAERTGLSKSTVQRRLEQEDD